MTHLVSLRKMMGMVCPGSILSMQPLPPHLDARQGLQAWPVPPPPLPASPPHGGRRQTLCLLGGQMQITKDRSYFIQAGVLDICYSLGFPEASYV